MRTLNKKQKKFLDAWIKKHKNDAGVAVDGVSLLTSEEYETIEKMNDFETLYQQINNYIGDNV